MLSMDYCDFSDVSSDNDSNDDVDDWQNTDVTTIQKEDDNGQSTSASSATLSEKFEQLKKRRLQISDESKNASSSVPLQKDKKSTKPKDNIRERKAKLRDDNFRELNKYMPHAFKVKNRNDVFKKTKIETELDDAIKEKDFKLAERLNDEMVKRNFATQVKSAMEAQKYAKGMEEKEERKKIKKRKKLKWSFDQKERWETKGNM